MMMMMKISPYYKCSILSEGHFFAVAHTPYLLPFNYLYLEKEWWNVNSFDNNQQE